MKSIPLPNSFVKSDTDPGFVDYLIKFDNSSGVARFVI
jgi:hypothetical protein